MTNKNTPFDTLFSRVVFSLILAYVMNGKKDCFKWMTSIFILCLNLREFEVCWEDYMVDLWSCSFEGVIHELESSHQVMFKVTSEAWITKHWGKLGQQQHPVPGLQSVEMMTVIVYVKAYVNAFSSLAPSSYCSAQAQHRPQIVEDIWTRDFVLICRKEDFWKGKCKFYNMTSS